MKKLILLYLLYATSVFAGKFPLPEKLWAIYHEKSDTLETVFDENNIDEPIEIDSLAMPPLFYALVWQKPIATQALLRKGADYTRRSLVPGGLSDRSDEMVEAFQIASGYSFLSPDTECRRILLTHIARKNKKKLYPSKTAITTAVENENIPQIETLLVDPTASLAALDHTPLECAFLDNFNLYDFRDASRKITAVDCACQSKNKALVMAMKNARPDEMKPYLRDRLYKSVDGGALEDVRFLLSVNADVVGLDQEGRNALHFLEQTSKAPIIAHLLLQEKPSTLAQGGLGCYSQVNPLHTAIIWGGPHVLALLLAYARETNQFEEACKQECFYDQEKKGMTPEQLAQSRQGLGKVEVQAMASTCLAVLTNPDVYEEYLKEAHEIIDKSRTD